MLKKTAYFFLITVSALLLTLSVKSLYFGIISLFSLVIPLILVINTQTYRRVAVYGFIFGFAFFFSLNDWFLTLIRHGPFWVSLGWLISTVYLSLFTIGAFITLKVIHRKVKNQAFILILWPIAWTAFEFLRMLGPLSFPWGALGYSLIGTPPFGKLAYFLGWAGLSSLVVVVNSALTLSYISLRHCDRKRAALILACPIVLIMLSLAIRIPVTPVDTKVSSLRTNFNSMTKFKTGYKEKQHEEIYSETKEALREGSSLVVLPESVFSSGGQENFRVVKNKEIIFGSLSSRGYKTYNSVFLKRGNSLKNIYDKNNLVLFGEYVPLPYLIDTIPVLYNSLSAGGGKGIFKVVGEKTGLVICSESADPFMIRERVVKGAGLIIILTNDEWFGGSSLIFQHIQLARLRAVESGRYVVQSANGGASAIINNEGVIRAYKNKGMGYISSKVSFIKRNTFYNKAGWIFPYITIAILLIVGACSLVSKLKKVVT